jgi:ribosomal protein S18 acetylase RimI-like enzyme
VNESISVETLSSISPDDAAALARLLGQLSTTATFDTGRLHAIIDHEATELLVARVGGQIVGMATFVSFPLPTGLRGHVEDVVVDESMRGRGIAQKLLETMTTMAGERGLRTLDLTSRPSRESALRLYEGVGFRRRETNILRYTPSERSPPQSVQGPARDDRAFAVWNPLNGTLRAMQWTR